jgi:hypothetical protein
MEVINVAYKQEFTNTAKKQDMMQETALQSQN